MTKEEFISKLKERKNLKTAEEVVEIALPIVQFYLNNYQGTVFKQIKDKFIEIDFTEAKINIPDTPERINLTNLAYISLLNRVEEFETL
jgi:predicted glycosyltransferase involved in capsule biosynthesis